MYNKGQVYLKFKVKCHGSTYLPFNVRHTLVNDNVHLLKTLYLSILSLEIDIDVLI